MTLDPPGKRVSDTDAWRRTSEALLLGVFHDISSRVSALTGIARMARMDVSFEETLLPLLESEVAKLTRSMELAKLLPQQPRAGSVSVGDLVPLALELHRHHPDLGRLEYRYDAGITGALVDMDASTLGHSLLSVFSLLGWSALRDGFAVVDVQIVEEGSWIVIKAGRSGADGPATDIEDSDDITEPTEEVIDAIRLAAEEAGGEVTAETSEGGRLTSFQLRLPPIRPGQRAG